MHTAADNANVLVRLTGITQELTVGIGAAIASVRTLTDVSLTVCSRELVVIAGGRGGGERAVLAVIAGDERGVSGTREVHDNARLRVMRISASSALALAQEWQRAGGASREHVSPDVAAADDASTTTSSPPVHEVFLLDVLPGAPVSGMHIDGHRRADSEAHAPQSWRTRRVAEAPPAQPREWDEKNRAALAHWAQVCQQRGGAILMATDEAFGLGLIRSGAARSSRAPRGDQRVTAVRETPQWHPLMRVVAMHCGRLAASVRMPVRRPARAS